MAKPKTKSSAEIVADAIGWDVADVEDLRYQSTRTTVLGAFLAIFPWSVPPPPPSPRTP